MRGFSCFLKFLVVAFISQGTAFLLASEPEGGGGVVVEVPRDARSGSPTSIMDNEYPGGQFPLEPLVLPTSSSSSRLPAMSPTSFSTVVIATLTVLKTTEDYVEFMRKIHSDKREALSKHLNIDGVIKEAKKEITRLQDDISKTCHDVLYDNGFNWRSNVGIRCQGYFAIAEGVMKLLKTQKNLAEHFNVPLNTEAFGTLLEGTLLKCQETLKEISKKKSSLGELIELTHTKEEVVPPLYSWNACD